MFQCCLHYVYVASLPSLYIFVVTTINFDKSTYSIDEYDGAIHPTLILSNPVSTDVTVKVLSTDGSANGEHLYYI